MTDSEIKSGDTVRLLEYPEDSINGYGRVQTVLAEGGYWVTNMNQPFQGTISLAFRPHQIKKV